jgi:Domain of unknown function (DUF4389)
VSAYPVRLEARYDQPGRALWLVKWLLMIPHVIALAFLWFAVTLLWLVVFFAVLFTGRYPLPIFDFNLGVMRWTWRVWYYGYFALGTDRYPPFSLGEVPDYPATLDADYPETMSRGLVLVKWWLLALPHYLVVTFFLGGGGFLLWQWGSSWSGPTGGLITILAVFAGGSLLFTGAYPPGIFDFVIGLDRWVLRVSAYAALMTDVYPPFRLDQGGTEPGDRETPASSTAAPTPSSTT